LVDYFPMNNRLILETDQKDCFDESGNKIPCSESGQDAEHKKDGIGAKHRFKDRNDIVEDNLTGLFWCRNANLSGFPLTWREALDYVEDMNSSTLFGHSNWKLPSRRELFSLISHQYINPTLPKGHPFINVFPGYYWTKTTCNRLTDQAWYIHLGGGRIYRGMKHGSYMVWPVYGPEQHYGNESERFEIEEIYLRDRLTGLLWLKYDNLTYQPVNWKEVFSAVERLNSRKIGGYSNWCLPNIRELESITDMDAHSPALYNGQPFQKMRDGYWSSTTSVFEPSYAWVLYTQDGAIGVGFKSLPEFYICAVRSGSD
jgi:hypothetical protein